MSLAKYHQKRHFKKTPEPVGREQKGRGPLRFVVQKHQASRLHYDFRLELDGTLKSWAVPKGPSLNPADKRLAMMVEDHPLDYRTFEGNIPKGNYGAGSVMVWDQGTYTSRATAERKESERLLRKGLREGQLTFVLSGEKLKGEFSLVRLKRGEGNAWLLIKKRDQWASDDDVTAEDRSVVSGRNLEEIAGKIAKECPKQSKRKKPSSKSDHQANGLSDAPRGKMPHKVRPMLATLVAEPFDRPGWIFELKWDGYRAIAEVSRKRVALYSRNHKPFEHRFAPLVESLRQLGHEAVLDGEIVVVDSKGKSSFQLLQNYQKTGQGNLRYYAFDLLHLDGNDLRGLPLRRRKELLAEIFAKSPLVLLSEHEEVHGKALFEAAARQGLEGIIAKDGDSPYREGARSHAWLKIKTHRRQEAVIGGFTEPRGSRKDFGALVLGVYDGDELTYIGHTGGGFNVQSLADLRARLEPLIQRTWPFRSKPKTNAAVHWVKPQLVCEVSFQEWTRDGIMRMPIFVGLREDKLAKDVRREEPEQLREALVEATPRRRPSKKNHANRTEAPALANLTNLQKVFWPDEGYTKGNLIDYYRMMAPILLPYLHNRPESLHRHPNGIHGESFFQKDVSRQPPPDWVKTVAISSNSEKKRIIYLLCQNEATLLYLANLGCIELNPWNSRVGSLERPDYMILDCDPVQVPFERVIEAAREVRATLERAGAPSFCKTSGKRGLHVFVPLAARYDTERVKQFAELIANLVHLRLPETTSVVRNPAQRQGRVYLDFLQNRRGQTLAAPYSVRPYPGATVSTPLKWSEVRKGLDPSRFTIKTMARRLDRVGDLWQPVLGEGIDLTECLKRLGN